MNPSQFLIWTGQQLNPGVPLYNMALAFYIDGEVDVDRFRRAFASLVGECQSLRTVFLPGPQRRVLEGQPAPVEWVDLGAEEVVYSRQKERQTTAA